MNEFAHLHTLLCNRCSAIMGISDDDEDHDRERRCPHCGLKFRLHRQDSRDESEPPDERFAKRLGRGRT